MSGLNENCELCRNEGGAVLWRSATCRVIRVDDPHYPGFCRVIRQDHVREMTDLPEAEQHAMMRVVFAVERVVRDLFQPDKINLASFGNMVPHVHWHVIPRWSDDRHFPQPVWGVEQRLSGTPRPVISTPQLAQALAVRLAPLLAGRPMRS